MPLQASQVGAAPVALKGIDDGLQVEFLVTIETNGVSAVTVKFDNLAAVDTGGLVQAVDVLGNHRMAFSLPDQLGDCPVTAIGLGTAGVPVDLDFAPPCLDAHLLGGDEVLKLNGLHF